MNSDHTFFNRTILETVYTNHSYLVNLDRYELARDNILRDHVKHENEDHFLGEFERHYGRTTTILPLSKERFHLTIDNALFEVYINRSEMIKRLEYTVLYETKMNLSKFNYTLCFGRLPNDRTRSLGSDEIRFLAGKNAFKRNLKIMHKKNLPSLVIDFFNACSLWLTLSLFDLAYFLLMLIEQVVLRLARKNRTRIIVINSDLYDQLRAERPESIVVAEAYDASDSVQLKGIVIIDEENTGAESIKH